ncbi:MAG TPA: 2-amino-4-hydroxy-6-hydroxymethyldihydropteridine diphosphokinase [Verrucomicrobiales bacterium]|nr:2-amino-4-hydroxy-6-hydroxymethyldihydropteridine diphosphokinase [Verrucomicrobiales bacterium]
MKDALPYGLALGSNLGRRLDHLRHARDRLLALPQSQASSLLAAAVYETLPVDCPPGSRPFLNTVIELRIDLPPLSLLVIIQGMERRLGRVRTAVPNAPRALDIDLLYAGDAVLEHPQLVLPHPRLSHRAFVLVPLADIRPGWTPPGSTVAVLELLQRIPEPRGVTLYRRVW